MYKGGARPEEPGRKGSGKKLLIGAGGVLAALALISGLKFATPRVVPEHLPAAKKTEAVRAGAPRLVYAPPRVEYNYGMLEKHPYSALIKETAEKAKLPPEWGPLAAALLTHECGNPKPGERIKEPTKEEKRAIESRKVTEELRGKLMKRGIGVNDNGTFDAGFGNNSAYFQEGVDYYNWDENAKAAMKRLLVFGVANARHGWDGERGRGSFDRLPEYKKMALAAYEYNQGHVEKAGFFDNNDWTPSGRNYVEDVSSKALKIHWGGWTNTGK
ncbi:hypothetical protein COU36_01770 [Candidatus Micrarchaeota archaeon CG10_big_fil_rev_8_21_14_0_10_59_7]|nr:MAG: hypothetical protein COU36_01770 [Candidatus Micrarchaeota archaeon CG10_big_fil_rev_8_21_14_0_10_59_7]